MLRYTKNINLIKNTVKLNNQYQLLINRNFHYSKFILENLKSLPIVEIEELTKLIKANNSTKTTLIDVREVHEHKEGAIPTAKLIPVGELESAFKLDASQFEAKYGFKKPSAEDALIFHCRSGVRSQKATELATQLGFKNSRNYKGSMLEFSEKQPHLVVKN